MAETGILSENDRVELIEGEIIEMHAISSRHSACVMRLNALISKTIGQSALVSVQSPIRLGDRSEPEPDIALLAPKDNFYSDHHPTPDDIYLVIEVSDSSLGYDREIKLPLYARARIPEFWIVNLLDEAIEIYKQPSNNNYTQSITAGRGDSVQLPLDGSITYSVDEILG